MPLDNLFIHPDAAPVGADADAYPTVDACTSVVSSPVLYPCRGSSAQLNAAEDQGWPSVDARC